MTAEIRNTKPFTSTPRPHPVYWLGAYKDKKLCREIPCYTEQEANACGAALVAQEYEIRIRTGARVPQELGDDD
jgi:hypothetical protein